MNKRLIAMLLVVAFCMNSFVTPLHAKEISKDDLQEEMTHYITTEAPDPVPATNHLKALYSIYELDLNAIKRETGCSDEKSAIISACSYIKTEMIADCEFSYYEDTGIRNYLPEVETIYSIETMYDLVSVIYLAKDGKEVYLTYGNADNSSVSNAVVYDPSTDICYFRDGEEATVFADYRYGNKTEMTEEYASYVSDLFFQGDIEKIEALGDVVIITDNGIIGDNSIDNPNPRSTPSNASLIYNELVRQFPIYNGQTMMLKQTYCSALSSYRPTKATMSRNAYTQNIIMNREFASGAAVSLLTAYMGFLSGGTTTALLSALGVSVSSGYVILSGVILIKSGNYYFQYAVYGAVNDNIRYNGYINTYTYVTTGTFTGGYNNNGSQTWVSSINVSTSGNSYQYAITNAMSAYNTAVTEYLQNGYSYPWFPPTYGPD